MLADEPLEGELLALAGLLADPGGDHVHDRHLRVKTVREVAGHAKRQLRVRAPSHRHQDRADLFETALLDHGDVAWGLANDSINGRREDRGHLPIAVDGGAELCTRGGRRVCAESRSRRRTAPAEDEQVCPLLGDRLDDPFRRSPADADHGPDLDALLVAEGEDALEQPAGIARRGGTLGERVGLRYLDDAQRGHLCLARGANTGANAHQVASGAGVGKGQEDPVRRPASGGHQSTDACQRVTRYGLSCSNSTAWASIARSACSVVSSSVSLMNPAVRPK